VAAHPFLIIETEPAFTYSGKFSTYCSCDRPNAVGNLRVVENSDIDEEN
jgi:hypothetical protein